MTFTLTYLRSTALVQWAIICTYIYIYLTYHKYLLMCDFRHVSKLTLAGISPEAQRVASTGSVIPDGNTLEILFFLLGAMILSWSSFENALVKCW